MNRHVALLRGINVSGHRPVPMATLRALFQELGCPEVSSYIQSGNVVYVEPPAGLDRGAIETALLDRFGFEVTVVLRRDQDLESLISHLPFGQEAEADPRRVAVAFLSSTPGPAAAQALRQTDLGDVQAVLHGREVFLHWPGGMAGSKFDIKRFERSLGCASTTRNWRTVLRLARMCAE